MATNLINIGYGGWLQCYDPEDSADIGTSWFKKAFLDYRIDNVDHSIRSAYFLFKAVQIFKSEAPELASKVRINLWGKIDPGNIKLAEKLGITENVKISGLLSKTENLKQLDKMNMLFLPMEVGKNEDKSLFIPGKVYEYMLLRKPILAIGGDSDAKQLILDSGLGFHFEHDKLDALVKFLHKICIDQSNLEVNANEDLINSKSFDKLTDKLVEVFKNCKVN